MGISTTESLLESLPPPVLIQLGHILLGNPQDGSNAKGGVGIGRRGYTFRAKRLHDGAAKGAVAGPSRAELQEILSAPKGDPISRFLGLSNVIPTNTAHSNFAISILLALCRIRKTATPPYSSKLHEKVSATLAAMDIPHINEFAVFGGVYTLDIVLGDSVAIEDLRYNAETLFKQRVLTSLGWTIYSLPYKDWEGAKGDEAKKALLASILERPPVGTPSDT
ncbi:hypothetical protein T484DRAFT_1791218 [Baffinella frigidus]|nr:hypothetical protein T484DRAFT_1791218 [Cryptophyta sp. CCMP2293]